MTHSYVWHDSFICVTWLIHVCDMTHPYVWHDSFICVTWLIYMCDLTHLYVWHDSFTCPCRCMIWSARVWRETYKSWRVRCCGAAWGSSAAVVWMNHVPHDESCPICVMFCMIAPCPLWGMSHMNGSCHLCEWVMSLMNVTWLIDVPYEWVMSPMWKSHVPHECEGHDSCHTYIMSHVPCVNTSCPLCEWVMSLMKGHNSFRGRSHVTHIYEKSYVRPIYRKQRGCSMEMSCHIWMSHVT